MPGITLATLMDVIRAARRQNDPLSAIRLCPTVFDGLTGITQDARVARQCTFHGVVIRADPAVGPRPGVAYDYVTTKPAKPVATVSIAPPVLASPHGPDLLSVGIAADPTGFLAQLTPAAVQALAQALATAPGPVVPPTGKATVRKRRAIE